MYLDGHVIIRRTWKPADAKPKRRGSTKAKRRTGPPTVYTLHREDCFYAVRSVREKIPAPIEPYIGTIPCSFCKPELGYRSA